MNCAGRTPYPGQPPHLHLTFCLAATGLSAAAALRVATQGQKSVHIFEKTAMTARGAAILVGVNGLKALQAIDPQLLDGLLAKATKLEGSGALQNLACLTEFDFYLQLQRAAPADASVAPDTSAAAATLLACMLGCLVGLLQSPVWFAGSCSCATRLAASLVRCKSMYC